MYTQTVIIKFHQTTSKFVTLKPLVFGIIFAVLLSSCSWFAISKPLVIEPFNITDKVKLQFSALQTNRKNKDWVVVTHAKNTSRDCVTGPLQLVVYDLPNGVSVKNGTLFEDKYYLPVKLPDQLLEFDDQANQRIIFHNPKKRPLDLIANKNIQLLGHEVFQDCNQSLHLNEVNSSPSVIGLKSNGEPKNNPESVVFNVSTRGLPAGAGLSNIVLNCLSPVCVDKANKPISVLTLNDNGDNGDEKPLDGFYSVTAQISMTGIEAEQCFPFYATADITGGGTAVSARYNLCVTGFPVGIDNSNILDADGNIIEDDTTIIKHPTLVGEKVVKNELVLNVRSGISEKEIKQLVDGVGGTVVGTVFSRSFTLYQVRLSLNSDLFAILDKLNLNPLVRSATPNVIIHANVVNDPNFLPNQSSSVQGLGQIKAETAWEVFTDKNKVPGANYSIAILDSGIDINHGEFNGAQSAYGSFTVATDNCTSNATNPFKVFCKKSDYIDGDNNPVDGHGHGTRVAGIASASTDNGLGIAGVSWGSSLDVIRVLSNTNSMVVIGTTLTGISGIVNAGTGSSQVINASFTSGYTILGSVNDWCDVVQDAITDDSGNINKLLVAAAGNIGTTSKQYPAACNDDLPSYNNGILAVANAQSDDTLHSSSSYGAWVDLAAPGVDVYSTEMGNTYGPGSAGNNTNIGSSFSAPFVSGAAAVLLSRGIAIENIEQRLKETSVPVTGAKTIGSGGGRIDLYQALFPYARDKFLISLFSTAGAVAETVSFSISQDEFTDTTVDASNLVGISSTANGTFASSSLSLANGVASVSGSDITYTPNSGTVVGDSDEFYYQIIETNPNNTQSATHTAKVTINVVAENATEPAGDAGDACCDLIAVAAVVSDGTLKLSARLAPGHDPATDLVYWGIDTDQNSATGHPGMYASGTPHDNLGVDYLIRSGLNEPFAQILIFSGTFNQFTQVTNAFISYRPDGMDITVPLANLGNDDGIINFKVGTSKLISPPSSGPKYYGGFTGVLDVIPSNGLPPATN